MTKLHIGCGDRYKKGYINVDLFDSTIADLMVPADALPLDSETVELIESYHLIEHFGYTNTLLAFNEWWRVLKPGGKLILETPDIETSFKKFTDSSSHDEKALLLNWIFGHEFDGYTHKFCFPKILLKKTLEETGFTTIEIQAPQTHPYAPGYRIECEKLNDPYFGLIGSLRHFAYKTMPVFKPINFLNRMELEKILSNHSVEKVEESFKQVPIEILFLKTAIYSTKLSGFLLKTYQELAQQEEITVYFKNNIEKLLEIQQKLETVNFTSLLYTQFLYLLADAERKSVKFFYDATVSIATIALKAFIEGDEHYFNYLVNHFNFRSPFIKEIFSLQLIQDRFRKIRAKEEKYTYLEKNSLLNKIERFKDLTYRGKFIDTNVNPVYIPDYAIIEVTLGCNFKCMHCGASAGKKRQNELTIEEVSQISKDLKFLGCKGLTLMGGEILIRKDWAELAKAVSDQGLSVSIITNAYFLDDEKVKLMKSLGVHQLGISLDGATSETQERIRGVKGSFEKAIEGIKLSLENKMKFTTVITAVTKINFLELADIFVLLAAFNAPIDWQLKIGSSHDEDRFPTKYVISEEEYFEVAQFLQETQKIIKQNNLKLSISGAHDMGYQSAFLKNIAPEWKGCLSGTKTLGIQSNGNVTGCLALLDDCFVEGNIRERSLIEIWDDPHKFLYNRKPNFSGRKGICKDCDKANICPGGCTEFSYTLNNRSLHEPPYCLHQIEKKMS